jgi:hypothetical protein
MKYLHTLIFTLLLLSIMTIKAVHAQDKIHHLSSDFSEKKLITKMLLNPI